MILSKDSSLLYMKFNFFIDFNNLKYTLNVKHALHMSAQDQDMTHIDFYSDKLAYLR
jgi:hypothetical protein